MSFCFECVIVNSMMVGRRRPGNVCLLGAYMVKEGKFTTMNFILHKCFEKLQSKILKQNGLIIRRFITHKGQRRRLLQVLEMLVNVKPPNNAF